MKEKVEYREVFSLKSTLLLRGDLLSLEKLLIENRATDRVKINITFDSTSISASSFNELFSDHELPPSTDKLSINMERWIDTGNYQDISSEVNLSLHHNHAYCHIRSIDQTWFLGKKKQIERYFSSKIPWYSFLNKLEPAYPTVALALLVYGSAGFSKERYVEMIFPIATSVSLAVITFLIHKQKLFPFVKIQLKETPKLQFGFNEWCALIGALASVATLVQVFSEIFK